MSAQNRDGKRPDPRGAYATMRYLNLIAICALCTASLPRAARIHEIRANQEESIRFQVSSEEAQFHPRARARLKFLVTNDSDVPLYLSRPISTCGSPVGFVELKILDKNGLLMLGKGCSSDTTPIKDEDMPGIIQLIRNSPGWTSLKRGETYTADVEIELPKKKGVYELKAELFPTSFTNKQTELLSQNGIRVLLKSHVAPVLKIKVSAPRGHARLS
jgi:hypothetical protein